MSGKKPFGRLTRHIWRMLAITLFDEQKMVISPDQLVENLQYMFSRIEGSKPREVRISLVITWAMMGAWFFDRKDLNGRRHRLEKRMRRTRTDLYQDMARLRGLVFAGYYGHWLESERGGKDDTQHKLAEEQLNQEQNPVIAALGFTLPSQRQRAGGLDDPKVTVNLDRDLPDNVFCNVSSLPDDVDVIVIGSGAGGAVAASNLAAQGYRVLIIEEGAHHPARILSANELEMSSVLFRDGAIQTTKDNDIIVFQGRSVGGSTVINNGICLRLHKNDPARPDEAESHPDAANVLDKWASLGAPVSEADLVRSYERVEDFLQIEQIHERLGRNNGSHLMNGWRNWSAQSSNPWDKRAIARTFRKNWGPHAGENRCVASGYCNTGCPYGRKHAMPESFLRHACGVIDRDGQMADKPGRILPAMTVRKILWHKNRGKDGRKIASGVQVEDRSGRRFAIHARKGVVVAAGAIASSKILRKSGIRNAGQNISLNIACPVVAQMPHEVRAWDEDQMATYVDRGDFLLESHFQPPMSMSTLMPGWFDDHFNRMSRLNHMASAGVLFPADRRGRMKGDKLSFKLYETDLAVLRDALTTLCNVHFAAGAEVVYPATLVGDAIERGRSPEEIRSYFEQQIREPDDVVLSSSHPHGGNVINRNPDKGAVDLDQRLHAATNVLVADASVMPSSIRVNAQLTTMAMSDRATCLRPDHGPVFG